MSSQNSLELFHFPGLFGGPVSFLRSVAGEIIEFDGVGILLTDDQLPVFLKHGSRVTNVPVERRRRWFCALT